MAQTIAVLDFGSQYTQVIARRVRECRVYSKIYRFGTSAEELRREGVIGIILSGGPSSVFARNAPMPDPAIFELGVPVLGICYGLQLMGRMLGGVVARSDHREYGRGALSIRKAGRLFADLPRSFKVWNSHGDRVTRLPRGFAAIGTTENSPYAAFEDAKRRFYAIQFHPEVFHTEHGVEILRNFLVGVCGAGQDWTMRDFIAHSIENIRATVGDSRVILGLSGGVDSSVAAALIHKAVGRQLTCVFVDNGLLRLGEREAVATLYRKNFQIDVRVVDASKQFLSPPSGRGRSREEAEDHRPHLHRGLREIPPLDRRRPAFSPRAPFIRT